MSRRAQLYACCSTRHRWEPSLFLGQLPNCIRWCVYGWPKRGGKVRLHMELSFNAKSGKRIAGAVTGTANYRVSSSRLSWLSNVYDRVECRANELWLEVRQSFS